MNPHPTEPKRRLRIWQQNMNRSLEAQLDFLHSLKPSHYNMAAIQEPYIDFLGNSRATPHWIRVYPPKHHEDPKATRSIILVNKTLISTNAWTQLPVDSPDITAISIDSSIGTLHLYNIYNNGSHSGNLRTLEMHLQNLGKDQTAHEEVEMLL
jgi:hypothetical protein